MHRNSNTYPLHMYLSVCNIVLPSKSPIHDVNTCGTLRCCINIANTYGKGLLDHSYPYDTYVTYGTFGTYGIYGTYCTYCAYIRCSFAIFANGSHINGARIHIQINIHMR